jgi:hypothetical protein
MRNPSIHVTLSDLTLLLKELGLDNPKQAANKLLTLAHERHYQRRDRVLVTTTAAKGKTLKKVIAKPNADNTNEFGSILELVRRKLKHKLVQTINPQSKDYNVLKEVALLAYQFNSTFDLPKQIGYQRFIELGVSLMRNKYSLSKFKFYAEKIFSIQEAHDLISNDPSPLGTDAIACIYDENLRKQAGINLSYTRNDYQEWVNFYYTRLDIETYKANPLDWIAAQFEGLAFMSAIPELSQLYGDNAYKRYIAYLTNKQAQKKNPNNQPEQEEPVKDSKLRGYFDKLT